jgi:hypothetical protein
MLNPNMLQLLIVGIQSRSFKKLDDNRVTKCYLKHSIRPQNLETFSLDINELLLLIDYFKTAEWLFCKSVQNRDQEMNLHVPH